MIKDEETNAKMEVVVCTGKIYFSGIRRLRNKLLIRIVGVVRAKQENLQDFGISNLSSIFLFHA